MDTDPFVLLRSLREEFRAAAEHTDGHFIRLTLARAPMLKQNGTVDPAILRSIDEAVEDGRELALNAEWFDNPGDPDCFREIVVNRPGERTPFYGRFEELAAGTMRCLLQIPEAVEVFKLGDVSPEEDDLACDDYWMGVLMQIARTDSHPVLRVTEGPLVYEGKEAKLEFFNLGGSTIAVNAPKVGTLARMKKLAQAKTSCVRLQCGILRGSAYAIDWILARLQQTP
ncbi:MAG: hypothetical protein ACM359_18380 [Bacillota bacterium]